MGKINWFWVHRRNASLHHFSFLIKGLSGRGWQPAVDFWFDNQIVVGVPGKGCYVFYDKNQLKSGAKYKDIQDSIDSNADFVKDFRRRTDEIFGALFFKCINIDLENLTLLADEELLDLYRDFIKTVTMAPIITVQLWGIEACFDDRYKIEQFLRSRLQELGKAREFEEYKGLLQVNTGETVAFSEQKDFFRIAVKFSGNPEVRELFVSSDAETIGRELDKYKHEKDLLNKHIEKYQWINTEYVSEGWSREKWIQLFKNSITSEVGPEQKLDEVVANFKDLNSKRNKVIDELAPPEDVKRAIDALSEFISQRDWTKGYFTRVLLSYHKLLGEVSRRLEVKIEDLFQYSFVEVDHALGSKTALPESEVVSRRSQGFMIVVKDGEMSLITGKEKIAQTIEVEGIAEPFEKVVNVGEFKGLPASRGFIRGRARVLEDASTVSQLQEGEILVTYMTTIEFIPAFRKAAAVVTDEGGISCHAAIISREFKLPCVVGTRVATRAVQTGDLVEVDANSGVVRILESAG